MSVASVTAQAPPIGWTPQAAITARFPQVADLARQVDREIRSLEAELDRLEAGGGDTACPRQILRELRWRLEYTGDADGIRAAIARLRSGAAEQSPDRTLLSTRGACSEVWFLRLDDCVDDMLAGDFDAGDIDNRAAPLQLLDRINNPARLRGYLESLLVSRLDDDGIDRRKELNFATADLVRLILWRRPRSYDWDPQLDAVIRDFVAAWQDPDTGFFGAEYLVGGRRFRTVDLSLTFHMARYLDGAIGYWPQLIDTLLAMRDDRYPNGWLDEIGMTSHNNYDVAVLFQLGWRKMRADQHQRAQQELARMLDWCTASAVAPDGRILARAIGESLPEGHYFTIAFLDTVGYFDPAKRFWSARDFPEAPALRARLEERLAALPQRDPMVKMARDRLRRAVL
jgi:hypothetical protein